MSYTIKKIHKKNKENKKPDTLLDHAALVGAFVSPLSALPQIIQLYSTRSANDLSLASWILCMIVSAIWVLYGISRHDIPMIIYQSLWLAAQTLIILAIIFYGDVSTLWSFGF